MKNKGVDLSENTNKPTKYINKLFLKYAKIKINGKGCFALGFSRERTPLRKVPLFQN